MKRVITRLPILALLAMAAGLSGCDDSETVAAAPPPPPPAAETFRVQVLHASPAAGEVDVYVTTPGADIAIARDAAGGGAPLGLILLDDFTI